jgi:hypothetical protein
MLTYAGVCSQTRSASPQQQNPTQNTAPLSREGAESEREREREKGRSAAAKVCATEGRREAFADVCWRMLTYANLLDLLVQKYKY